MMEQLLKDLKVGISLYTMIFVLLFRDILLFSPIEQFSILLFIGFINFKRIDGLGVFWYGLFSFVTVVSCIAYDYMDPISTLMNTLLYIILCHILVTERKHVKYLFQAFTIWGTILFSYFLFHYREILGHGRLGDFMYDTSYGSSIGLAYYIISILCSAIITLIQSRHIAFKVLSFICVFLGFVIAIFNGAKKAYLMPIAFLLFYSFYSDRHNFLKLFLRISLLLAVLLVVWNQLKDIDILQRYFVNRVEAMFAAFSVGSEVDEDGSTTARLKYIPIAWNAFLDNPICGMGGLGRSCSFFRQTIHVSHPHNDFLNMLAAGGICLFVVFYWFPCKIWFLLYRKKDKEKGCILLLTLVTTLLFNNFNSTTFNIPVINIFYIIAYNYIILEIKEKSYARNSIRN